MKHKDWDIGQDYMGYWFATHPDYDPTPYEPDGVYGDYGHVVYGLSKDDVIKQIDE